MHKQININASNQKFKKKLKFNLILFLCLAAMLMHYS
ncbi:hypothetical protein MTE2_4426 [Klebsiella pneumoniae VA360]|nr:hypothetical protein MTE2_4426 [Klebsiella pneumoniae VA360]